MLVLLLSVGLLAVIVLDCAVMARILDASALPRAIRAAWLTAVILLPGIGAMLWLRVPSAARRGVPDRVGATPWS